MADSSLGRRSGAPKNFNDSDSKRSGNARGKVGTRLAAAVGTLGTETLDKDLKLLDVMSTNQTTSLGHQHSREEAACSGHT